jgi:hypothetical protein
LHEARAKVAYTSKFFQGARETLRLKWVWSIGGMKLTAVDESIKKKPIKIIICPP